MTFVAAFENKIDGIAANINQRPDGKYTVQVIDMDCNMVYATIICPTLEMANEYAIKATTVTA